MKYETSKSALHCWTWLEISSRIQMFTMTLVPSINGIKMSNYLLNITYSIWVRYIRPCMKVFIDKASKGRNNNLQSVTFPSEFLTWLLLPWFFLTLYHAPLNHSKNQADFTLTINDSIFQIVYNLFTPVHM